MSTLEQKKKNLDELRTKEGRLRDEIDELANIPELDEGQEARWTRQNVAFDKTRAEIARLEYEIRAERVLGVRSAIGAHPATEGGATGMHYAYEAPVSHRSTMSSTGNPQLDAVRDDASRIVDVASRSGALPDYAAERVEQLISSGSQAEQGLAARWAVASGSEAYMRAFTKLLADPVRGNLLWTPEEADAYRNAVAVRTALSTGSGVGGELIPLTLDPAIMLTSSGSINPIRQVARVVQTTSNTWQGVTSAGATAEWKTEAAEAADGSPALASPSIPVFTGDVFVPYSYEIGMDALNFQTELAKVMADAADNLMATAYTTGTGSAQPQGFVTGLAGTASEINGSATEALAAADLYTLQNALPPRFQANASWLGNIATINTIAQFETTNGALKFPEVGNDRLLRKPLHEVSDMDGTVVTTATASNYLLGYGSWSDAFVIVDRIGSTLELIPNLVGANGRPTGQRGAFLWFRTGSEVVNIAAARLLDVPTTA